MRFKITWCDSRSGSSKYTVNIPNFDGGEVVTIDEFNEAQDKWRAYEKDYILPLMNLLGWKPHEHTGETVVDAVRDLARALEYERGRFKQRGSEIDKLEAEIKEANRHLETLEHQRRELQAYAEQNKQLAEALEAQLQTANARVGALARRWAALLSMAYDREVKPVHCLNQTIGGEVCSPDMCNCTCAGCCYAAAFS